MSLSSNDKDILRQIISDNGGTVAMMKMVAAFTDNEAKAAVAEWKSKAQVSVNNQKDVIAGVEALLNGV